LPVCAIINEEVEKIDYKVEKIILFGSWARGGYRENNDYNFFSMKSLISQPCAVFIIEQVMPFVI